MFFWIDQEPETAFNQAATFFGILEVVWDTTSVVFNSAVDIINVGLIPVWNSAVYYIVEPILSLALEIFSVVFLRQSFPGVLPDDFGYTGVDCTASADAMAWCGRYDHYAKELESEENAPYYAAQSQTYKGMGEATAAARRSLLIAAASNETYVFGLSTARRLRALADDSDDIPLPAMRLGPLVEALDALSTFFLSIFPMLCDMFFAIAQEVLITSFSVIMDVIQIVLEQLMTTAKMLIKSGILTTLMGVGVDFLVIMFTELALPLLFAAIDLLMCVLDLFAPSGWNAQLECVEDTCFKGPSITTDLLVFTGVPIVLHRFTAIMDAMLNSRTGKRFSNGFKTGEFTTKGRTKDGITGTPIDNEEPETASGGNPINEFSLADDFADFLGTSASDKCAQCFVCKVIFGNTQTQSHYTHDIQVTSTLNPNQVPEVRLLWLLAASIGSLFSSSGFNTFTGNVTDHCLANGSWYADACGPRGAEALPYRQWRAGQYTAGFAQIDGRLFDVFAAFLIDMAEEAGPGNDALFAELVQAAHQWETVREDEDLNEKAAVFVYHM